MGKEYIPIQVAWMRFIADEARKQIDENPASVRFGLNSANVSITLNTNRYTRFIDQYNASAAVKSGEAVGIPADKKILDLGIVSKTGAETGLIECTVTGEHDTASIYGFLTEMEHHLGLLFNCTEKAIIAGYENKDGQAIIPEEQKANVRHNVHHNLQKIKDDMLQLASQETLTLQIQWLANKLDRKIPTEGLENQALAKLANTTFAEYIDAADDKDRAYAEFNAFIAGNRESCAEKLRVVAFKQMKEKGLLAQTMQQAIIDNLKSTPASYADAVIQNSATGQLTQIYATQHTAHHKKFGKDVLALVKILNEDGSITWRVPSIAPTGEKHKPRQKYIQDTQDKIAHIVETIKKEGGDSGQVVFYDLLTSFESERGMFTDNDQTWSTEIIIEAAHRFNKEQVKNNNNTSNLFLLCNLSVNQWGITRANHSKPFAERNASDEIFELADLSLLQALKTQLCAPNSCLTQDAQNALKTAADGCLKAYKDYLARSDADKPALYAQSREGGAEQGNLINDLLSKGLETRPMQGDELPAQKAARVLFLLRQNNYYGKREYGLLIQALNLTVQTNKVSGCKSANERFGVTADLSVAAKEDECLQEMNALLSGDFSEDKLDALNEKMLTVYNEKHLTEDAGMRVSLKDQGAVSKAEHYQGQRRSSTYSQSGSDISDEADAGLVSGRDRSTSADRKHIRASVVSTSNPGAFSNTNAFLSRLVTRWKKGGAGLQAHVFETGKIYKPGSGGGISNTFDALATTRDYHRVFTEASSQLNLLQQSYAEGPGRVKTIKRLFSTQATSDANQTIRASIAREINEKLTAITHGLDPVCGQQDRTTLLANVNDLQDYISKIEEKHYAEQPTDVQLKKESDLYRSFSGVLTICNDLKTTLQAEQKTQQICTGGLLPAGPTGPHEAGPSRATSNNPARPRNSQPSI
jgi:hypothetical protein